MNNTPTVTVAVGRKEPSPSQVEELKEGRSIMKKFLLLVSFSIGCGIVVTWGGFKLVKHMLGVGSFGLESWTLFSVHFIFFWSGIGLSVVLIAIVVFVLALIVNMGRR